MNSETKVYLEGQPEGSDLLTRVSDVISENQWQTAPEHRPQIKLVNGIWEIEIDKRTFEMRIPRERETNEKVVIEVRSK